MYGKMSKPMPMSKSSASMAKPASVTTAFKKSAVVGSKNMAGMSFKTTSGTKAYSVTMPK